MRLVELLTHPDTEHTIGLSITDSQYPTPVNSSVAATLNFGYRLIDSMCVVSVVGVMEYDYQQQKALSFKADLSRKQDNYVTASKITDIAGGDSFVCLHQEDLSKHKQANVVLFGLVVGCEIIAENITKTTIELLSTKIVNLSKI